MVEDAEGFLYPDVDTEKCIDCGLCETVCPELSQYEKRTPLRTLAAINKDEQIRLKSSSGGIFTHLAENVVNEGGVVFGARFDEQWQVVIDSSDTREGLVRFRGSKYVQARTEDSFLRCEQLLKEGRKVLYSGTPCQISGLKRFLQKEYDNLLAVDVVCRGVPSPKVWRMYLDEVAGKANVRSISMRDKAGGWQNYHFTVDYEEDGKLQILSSPNGKNEYMEAFLRNMILRPSCYQCKFRNLRSGSDITLGDYWGIDRVHPEMNDNKGICLVLVNTEKGNNALNPANIGFKETSFEEGYRSNPSISQSPDPWFRRKRFFYSLGTCTSVTDNIRKYLRPSFRMMLGKIKNKFLK